MINHSLREQINTILTHYNSQYFVMLMKCCFILHMKIIFKTLLCLLINATKNHETTTLKINIRQCNLTITLKFTAIFRQSFCERTVNLHNIRINPRLVLILFS
ncbi:hypothetical protein KOSB73_20068 [Klebsiella grimontii]|uniref:Uncharacterized protein n=1 Tax=Klebsiella grimontii TaxID=2058152 RepID=A0A285AXE4_9ENTR|nr:hypothetical protein KOSB73_20068 [Klebsiella grimontii]